MEALVLADGTGCDLFHPLGWTVIYQTMSEGVLVMTLKRTHNTSMQS